MSDGKEEIIDFSFDEIVAQLEPSDDEVVVENKESDLENEKIEAQNSENQIEEKFEDLREETQIEMDEEISTEASAEKNQNAESSDEKIEDSEKLGSENVVLKVENSTENSVLEVETSNFDNGKENVIETHQENLILKVETSNLNDEKEENEENLAENESLNVESSEAGEIETSVFEQQDLTEKVAIEEEFQFNPLDPESVGTFLKNMGVPQEIIESKKSLIDVMQRENALLDEILETQNEIHNYVREKNWDNLNEKLASLQGLSDTFTELEEERETLCALIDMRGDEDISPVLTQVRGKLQRSKIENHALNEYISTTRKFLQGVFDSVVPQRRNVLYSKNGKIVRPELNGVAVNISL